MEKNICLPLGLCQKKYASNATHLVAFSFLPQNTQEWNIASNSKRKETKKTKKQKYSRLWHRKKLKSKTPHSGFITQTVRPI